MSDLMSTGVSALLAFRSALDTTGHNIANASTPGYNRERVDLTTNPVGGVSVRQISRLSDASVFTRSLDDGSSLSRLDTFQQYATRVDGLMSKTETGLAHPLQKFFAAVDGVASDPQSAAARQGLLSAAGTLTTRFNDLQTQLDGAETDINSRLGQAVFDINQYAEGIASLNNRIALVKNGGGQAPNELMDQRDQMLNKLSQTMGIRTVPQDDGAINVFTAGGQSLIVGNTTHAMSLVPADFNSTRLEIAIGTPASSINGQVSGGLVGGLLDARSQLLDSAESRVGLLAVGTAAAFNLQHAQGMDQNGQLGGDFFAALSGSAHAATLNTGLATVSVGFADITQVTDKNYKLSYNGSVWALTEASTGAAVAMSGSGTRADPFVAAGLSLEISGSAGAGDSYRIEPTRNLAGQMQVAISDPTRIAAAMPVTVSAALANAGSGRIAVNGISDVSNPALLTPVVIKFTSANTYSINGSGSYAYTAGAAINANGWTVAINGVPASGDSFQVSAANANSGDNGNAKLLSSVGTQRLLDGGRSTLSSANTSLVSQTGNTAQQANLRRDAAEAIQQQTTKDRDAVSGVNLDEEAADLVRYQQAYQAAAQIISIAQTLFQSLLSATRGG